jgi:signal transduction histidine kinase
MKHPLAPPEPAAERPAEAARPLRVLILEDMESDAELLLRALRQGGRQVAFERVETAADMNRALSDGTWDVIISDYSMPTFDAPSALSLMRGRGMDLPFIIVSGTVGEEIAVEAMRAGVHDYFLKGKLGPRLVAAIEREMREASFRAERKRMQEQLTISDRMVSMGTLAAGVAHEINNPLASVMANLDLVMRGVTDLTSRLGGTPELEELGDELHDAREGAERIRNIVRDLKIFSRSEEDPKGAVDVQRVMESTLRMAWNEIRHRARLVRRYGQVPLVEASESRLGQVFLNLVVNAAQAIPEGRSDSNEIRIVTTSNLQGQVVVEVGDTGPGMTQEILEKLFQPFFTTKPVGIGTGLGLSICYRIVSDLGGSIQVSSEVGKGTVVKVVLPPAGEKAVATVPPVVMPRALSKRGKILVIDDEPMLVKVVQRTLASEHDVTGIQGAEAALTRIAAGERFDVILCDLMMPQMTGMDLHAELSKVAPEQAASMVFLTGGAFTMRARTFLDQVPNQRVEKPFDATHLRALINDRVR